MSFEKRFQQIAGVILFIMAAMLFLEPISSPNKFRDVTLGILMVIIGFGAWSASKKPDSN